MNNLFILKGKVICYIDIDSFHILSIRIGLGDNDPLGTSKRLNSKICSPDVSFFLLAILVDLYYYLKTVWWKGID